MFNMLFVLIVGQLTISFFNEYEKRLQSEPAKIRVRRWILKTQNILATVKDFGNLVNALYIRDALK